MNKKLIHVYTGTGKGKTTAAVGLAIRAVSRGFKTLFVQFFKNEKSSGEISMLKHIGIDVIFFNKVKSPLFYPNINKSLLKKEVKKAICSLNNIFSKEIYDLIILDEFICLIKEGLLSEHEAIRLISAKSKKFELVLTGRGATAKIIRLSDYVTVMQDIKHPYGKNIKARKGIEF